MAIAVDTNVLVYAHRRGAPMHAAALERLRLLAARAAPVGLPWPCVYEFLRVVTHPRICSPPSDMKDAWRFVTDLLGSPGVTLLSEGAAHAEILAALLVSAKPTSDLLYDARIAALAIEHGFEEILTEDRDFARFPGVRPVRLDS